MFIYKIVNKINNKIYVGQTKNFQKRKREHFRLLRNNIHSNPHLQRSYNKYGCENFDFKLLKKCSKKNLNFFEGDYIKKLNLTNPQKGYNILKGGVSSPFEGKTHKKESKLKTRNSLLKKNYLGFVGGVYKEKNISPWKRVWWARINFFGKQHSLGYFEDPLSCEILHNIVLKEL